MGKFAASVKLPVSQKFCSFTLFRGPATTTDYKCSKIKSACDFWLPWCNVSWSWRTSSINSIGGGGVRSNPVTPPLRLAIEAFKVSPSPLDHLLDEFVVIFGSLFVVANEVAQFGLLVLQCAVKLLYLTDQIRLLRRQTLSVRFHCYRQTEHTVSVQPSTTVHWAYTNAVHTQSSKSSKAVYNNNDCSFLTRSFHRRHCLIMPKSKQSSCAL